MCVRGGVGVVRTAGLGVAGREIMASYSHQEQEQFDQWRPSIA